MLRSHSPLPILVAALALPAYADEAPPPAGHQDQTLVVARSVMPRIAYRGLEPDQNPVRVEATVFPGRVFHGAIDGMVTDLVGDSVLRDTSTGGGLAPPNLASQAVLPLQRDTAFAAGGTRASGSTPLGMGASATGAVSRATSGIADAVLGVTSRLGGGP